MSRYAIVRGQNAAFNGTNAGYIVAVIEADESFATTYASSLDYSEEGEDFIHVPWLVDETVSINDYYDGTGTFSKAVVEAVAPNAITAYQLKATCLQRVPTDPSWIGGNVYDAIETYLNAIVDADEKAAKLLEWNTRSSWPYENSLLAEFEADPDLSVGFGVESIFLDAAALFPV
jgi:hypothetical protein